MAAKQHAATNKGKPVTNNKPAPAGNKPKPAPVPPPKNKPKPAPAPEPEVAEEEDPNEEEAAEDAEEGEEGEESSDEEGDAEDGEGGKKRPRKVLPDGTKQPYILKSGKKITGIWMSSRLCCPTCERKLPVTAPLTEAQKIAKAKERKQAAAAKGQEFFAYFRDLYRKAAEKAGEAPPSDEEILQMMAQGVASGGGDAGTTF